MDADLESRLKNDDSETWQLSMNELSVAIAMERCFGIGCLRWHPQGKEKRIGEFELVSNNPKVTIFIEVKTVFPRELEHLENHIRIKLFRYAQQIEIPVFLSVHIASVGMSESISGKQFKAFLRSELAKLNLKLAGQQTFSLPDYIDKGTGLKLKINTLSMKMSKKQSCHIGVIGGEASEVL